MRGGEYNPPPEEPLIFTRANAESQWFQGPVRSSPLGKSRIDAYVSFNPPIVYVKMGYVGYQTVKQLPVQKLFEDEDSHTRFSAASLQFVLKGYDENTLYRLPTVNGGAAMIDQLVANAKPPNASFLTWNNSPVVGGKRRASNSVKWAKTGRKAMVKGGKGKPPTSKTVFRNSSTGELRVRKMVVRQDGTKRATYVKF